MQKFYTYFQWNLLEIFVEIIFLDVWKFSLMYSIQAQHTWLYFL